MAERTYGISGSGMDIDSMVKSLMKAKKASCDSLIQKKTQLEWKKADYNTMYKSINDFRNNTVFNYTLDATLTPMLASSSNESAVTATATADATTFNHSINVTTLAESASMTSSAAIGGADKTNLQTQMGVTGKIKLTISDGTTTKELINDTSDNTYDTTGKSINDLVRDINGLGLNVKATYDATLDRFFLSNTKSGASSQITLSSTDAAGTGAHVLVNKLQLGADANLSTTVVAANFKQGKDAVFDLDGVVGLTQSSNKFVISGVSYNLKALGAATVSVSSDIDKVVANVKGFVEAYNTMLGTLNNKISEAKYKDYLPLTDDQKAAMKDSEITAWQDKAKSGLLHNDSIIRNIVNALRNNVSNSISGLSSPYNSAASIGITTGSYTENGKLYLDETKLRTALQADPGVVDKVFGVGSGSNPTKGIAAQMNDTLKSAAAKIVAEAGVSVTGDTSSSLAKNITSYKTRLADMLRRMGDQEDQYYTRFNAMESALSKLSQQSSWLAKQG